ncbi:hypothetical protein PR002_g24921 [Phytophthora rubi]|uniref:Uncharacterized protein n=1 Tax=Phytophthora rubi TaxID=129364 RepID=A0A6A3I8H4_9STRA|nr:hypothetical protein PR002_g24921 [Phytophthora rubi]
MRGERLVDYAQALREIAERGEIGDDWQSLEEVAKRRREVTRKAAAKTVGEQQQRRVVVETGDGDVRSVRRVHGNRQVQGTEDGAARGEAHATSQPAKPDGVMGGAKPHDEGTSRRVRFTVDEHGGVCAGTTAAPVAGRKTAVDGDDATRRVVIDLACASVVQTKEEQAEVVAQRLDAWMAQFSADVAPDEVVASTEKRDEEDEGGSPESVQQAMATETGAADEFLLGEDWMLQNGVKIDFTSCEMKWYDGGDKKVVPFSCTATDEEAERTVQVRLVRKQRVQTQTCR